MLFVLDECGSAEQLQIEEVLLPVDGPLIEKLLERFFHSLGSSGVSRLCELRCLVIERAKMVFQCNCGLVGGGDERGEIGAACAVEFVHEASLGSVTMNILTCKCNIVNIGHQIK